MRIAAYCRVSTEKEDQLNSLEMQKKFFTDYVEKTGDTLVKLYSDEGISGTKTRNRKEFQKMMMDAERGLFERVVVKDISRLARNTVDLLKSVRRLKELGIETLFLNAGMQSMGDSEFLLTMFAAMAQEESANLSKRVKFGKKINARRGRVPNIVYGYDKTIGEYFSLTINEKEAEVVRKIFDWYVNEGLGAIKIANKLTEMGLKTKRNCRWSQNAICRILTNEIYIGKVINGKQEVDDFLTGSRRQTDREEWLIVDYPELRIIDDETFKEAQKLLSDRYDAFKFKHERQSNKYLFSTLVKCKECGWSYRRIVTKYRNTYVRWVCAGRNQNGADSCPNKTTLEEETLISVLQEYFVKQIKNKKKTIAYVVNEFQRIYKAKAENMEYAKELRDKLQNIKKSREKNMDMYTAGLITMEELKERIADLPKEIEHLEAELEIAEGNMTKGDQLETILNNTFKRIEDIVDVHQMTNAQLRRIIDKIVVDKDGNVDIYLRVLSELGLDQTALINDDFPQGCDGSSDPYRSVPGGTGESGSGYQQGGAAYPRRACDKGEVRA